MSIPHGELHLADNLVPALDPGDWRIEVTHTVTLSADESHRFTATRDLLVSAPQFVLDPAAVTHLHPPAGSTGRFDDVLPHLVLNDALLPWERNISAAGATGTGYRTPWVALLVLTTADLIGATESPTRTHVSTVQGLSAAEAGVLKPAPPVTADVVGSAPCGYIQLSTDAFVARTPRLADLPYLAHTRQVSGGTATDEPGTFGVVIGNRFPAVPAGEPSQAWIVHLVSLEGMSRYLVDEPDFGACTSVALVSLASWTFTTVPDPTAEFRALAAALAEPAATDQWLRLPPGDTGTPVAARIADGYVPLEYRLRTGETTVGWYRGPLVPLRPAGRVDVAAFDSADSALIYDPEVGMFDASLAAAWEAGRGAALADRVFCQDLFTLRRALRRATDAIERRLAGDTFAAMTPAEAADGTVQRELLHLLSTELFDRIGKPLGRSVSALVRRTPAVDRTADLRALVADVRSVATGAVRAELDPVLAWIERLRLLHPVPFSALVPDDRMLPPESVRFFHLDGTWLRALVDGALSLGVQSSRDTAVGDLVRAGVPTTAMSGFLLRSDLVSGWPTLTVRGMIAGSDIVPTLRLDHLAHNVLLGVFEGTPDEIEFAEPREGLRFGVDGDSVMLRQPRSGTPTPLGAELGRTLSILPFCLRPGGTLAVDPADPHSAVSCVRAAVGPLLDGTPFGPADFALQMVKAPDAVRFRTQPEESR
ncbi:hypothetical protein ACIA8K_35475 [Catenuloplanes sp. NPDC051500]|uniref:hypothetical protein n=1 Tax=Catenuloplanes sp. NPDC051500 TaxID=3363959 RepID=UPI0037B8BB0E